VGGPALHSIGRGLARCEFEVWPRRACSSSRTSCCPGCTRTRPNPPWT